MVFFELMFWKQVFSRKDYLSIILRHGFSRHDPSYCLDICAISIVLTLLSIVHQTIHRLYTLHAGREGKLLSNICLLKLDIPTVIKDLQFQYG